MKIAEVRAHWLRYPIPEQSQHTSDFGRLRNFDMVLVEIHDTEGRIGYGEAKAGVGSSSFGGALVSLLRDEFAPLLVGQDPRDITRLWDLLYNGPRFGYARSSGRTFPELDRRGSRISALSGVDMALWDLKGKALNLPLYQLLGGRYRDSIPLYASGGWADESEIGRQLVSYRDLRPFTAFKMRIGAMDKDVNTSARRAEAAREALGPEMKLMVDAHGTFNLAEAKRFATKTASLDLAWFEEPVSMDAVDDLVELARSTDIPIAAGESVVTRFDFLKLLDSRCVDVLQPDPAICGGVTEVVRIASLASSRQRTVAPHLWGSSLLFAAGVHLATALPNVTILEYSLGFNPFLRELSGDPLQFRGAEVLPLEGPGLGIEIDTDFVKRYAVP